MTLHKLIQKYLGQRDRFWILALFAVACVAYLPFLGNPFIFDDANFTQERFLEHYDEGWFKFELRWLPNASLVWSYFVFDDLHTHIYRLTSLLLHTATAVALFYFIRRLIEAVIAESQSDSKLISGAWLAAAVFVLHPVMVYAAGYVIQRSILLATFFVLLMQIAYLRGLLTGKAWWLLLAVIAYLLAGLSKEHSALAPLLLMAETVLLRDKIQIKRINLLFTWIALALIGMLIVLLAKGVIGTPYETGAASMFKQQALNASGPELHLLSVLTQAGLFFKYLLLLILPNPAWMSIDMRETFVLSAGAWGSWLGAVGFIAYGALGVWMLFRPRWVGLAGLAMLYPWLLFLLEFSSIRVQEVFVLYRSYLWLPGMLLLLTLLLAKWQGRKVLIGVYIILIVLLSLSWNRLWVFADNYRLWNDAAKLLQTGKEPLASRVFYNRAQAAAMKGMWLDAVGDYERSIELWDERSAILYHDLGAAYFNVGRYQDALAQFDKALEIDPEYPKAYFNKGLALKRLGRDRLSMQQMQKSCELSYAMACIIVQMDPGRK